MPGRRCRKSSAIFLCWVMILFFWQGSVYPVQGYPSNNELSAVVAKVKENQVANTQVTGKQVTVKEGETLWTLAKIHKTTVEKITKLNNIQKPDLIKVGEKLWISKDSLPQEMVNFHTVEILMTEPIVNPSELQQEKAKTLFYTRNLSISSSDFLVPNDDITQAEDINAKADETKDNKAQLVTPKDMNPLKGDNQSQDESENEAEKATLKKNKKVSANLNTITQEELNLLARVIYAEARGERFEGQVAVGAVVLNRLKDPQFPDTIKEVIYQKGAFTAVSDRQIYLIPDETAYEAAKAALSGMDPTGGAIYYYNPRTATDRWIKSRPVIKSIGNHTFSI